MSTCASMNCPFIHYCRHYHLTKDRGDRCETQEAIIKRARAITIARHRETVRDTGAAVRGARLTAGMTQAALAAAIGVHQKDVSRWENGVYEPGARTIAAIAAATGTDIYDLI